MITRLLQGCETEQKIDLLLQLTNINSESVIGALKVHLVQGAAESMAYMMFDVKQQNFSRALKQLNKVNTIVETIIETTSIK
ncbi:PapB/FocB family fimbrial expression transcriptional regulator [Neptunicella sp. SCSIO 80796]|uniref:PapB/FocB family fimbrial expression transcriptional regulator n=1 Tax=Neptunicella plasticusilytica TaxID=3117012 RepID=UPI003A4D6606